MEMKKLFLSALILFLLTFFSGRAETKELLFADIITNYANIALAGYEDSLIMAGKLDQAIKQLLDKPSVTALAKARKAWIDARVPYQQTEVYRFGNKIVDDWEGRINAWPLDEGLIDYVQNGDDTTGGENELYNANVIAIDDMGVLIRGEPGAGKSQLALHFLSGVNNKIANDERQVLLVGDDYITLKDESSKLSAHGLPVRRGQIEVRGIGFISVPYVCTAKIELVVDLVPRATIERMPPNQPTVEMMGFYIPLLHVPANSITEAGLMLTIKLAIIKREWAALVAD